MKKIMFFILLFQNLLYSSILLDKNSPVCIEDYYIKSGRVYYLKSSNNSWSSTSENNIIQELHYGYTWDDSNSACVPQQYNILGISPLQWNFLTALTGILFGFLFMFFTVELFMKVGTRK